jgi:thiol-disulfide isomerase/thioredoxin
MNEYVKEYSRNKAGAILLMTMVSVIQLYAQIPERPIEGPVNLEFIALDGRKVSLAELRGKVILIDCWAMWCAPCLKEMPHIKDLYEKYRESGFEVVGISLDEKKAMENVRNFITKNSIPWAQRFEGRGFWEDSFRRDYGIQSLPTAYLVDKEGKIVNREARGDRLEPLIRKHLTLDN